MLNAQQTTTIDDNPVEILLVEDLRTDALLIQRALKAGGVMNPIKLVRDGQQALDYLFRHGDYKDQEIYPNPGLILLDLKLPKVNGLEVIRQVKKAEILRRIPIVVLTASDQSKDINTAYDAGANSYLVKPVTFTAFIEVANKIKPYWLLQNKSPSV